MDYDTIARAGLTQEQFGRLLGVSRVTVNTWVMKKRKPTASTRVRVQLALRVLQAAVERGDLPIEVETAEAKVNRFLAALAAKLAPKPATPKG